MTKPKPKPKPKPEKKKTPPSPLPKKRSRPQCLHGMTYKIKTGCGPIYIIINDDEEGNPFELFAQIGKAGGCAASQTQAIGRMVSLAWRSGISVKDVVMQLIGIGCYLPYGLGDKKITSCADAIAKAIKKHVEMKVEE